jgi:hypothetical protein
MQSNAAPAQDAGRLTVGWPVAQPLETMMHWSQPAPPGTDPAMVVDELRKLSPHEEKRAFDILRGVAQRGSGAVVLVLSAAAALVAAAIALAMSGFFDQEGHLQLAMKIAPPAETRASDAATPGGETSAPTDGPGERVPRPDAPAGDGQTPADGPGRRPPDPSIAQPPEVAAKLAVQRGPSFAMPRRKRRDDWVPLAGPSIGLDAGPSTLRREDLAAPAPEPETPAP